MRQKKDAVLCFNWSRDDASDLKIVRAHRAKYKRISAILDRNPAILDLAANDLKKLSEGGRRGRKAVYTAENLLRAVIFHTLEGDDLRGTIVRLSESEFLQDFLRLGNRPVMDYSFLDKAFKVIRPGTWERINDVLSGYAVGTGQIDPSSVRVDTTVTETPIHYPTDASLLWDSRRVLARLLREGRSLAPALCPHRFHDRKAKRAYHRITRYARSDAKARRRLVRRCWRELIGRVRRMVAIAEAFRRQSCSSPDLAVRAVGARMGQFLRPIRTVISTAERANLNGETVPASERVFSIFEPHTELIRRGKSGKPVEFGHVVLLSQTKEKFISGYLAMEHRIPDPQLGAVSVEEHERLFGAPPEALTGDQGFNPRARERAALEQRVQTVAIPRKLSDWGEVIGSAWQRSPPGTPVRLQVGWPGPTQ